MCVVSMVTDHYYEKWGGQLPTVPYVTAPTVSMITAAEIEEFRALLERAREYDRKNHEPDCELAEKKARLLKLAEELGVKIDFL